MKQSSTVKPGVPLAAEAAARLRRVETLLDYAMQDLIVKGPQAPCAQCAAALGEAVAELRALSGLVTHPAAPGRTVAIEPLGSGDRTGLRQQVNGLSARLQSIGRLLTAAAEFYSGWCAAAPASGYTESGYEAGGWANTRGPALVAVEA